MRRYAATRSGRTLLYLGQWDQQCSIVKQQACRDIAAVGRIMEAVH